MIIKLDSFLIQQTQRAYLWFYDWTGVYVGTIIFLLVTGSWFLEFRSFWTAAIGILIVVPVCGLRYHLQSTDEDAFNAMAEHDRQYWMRGALTVMAIGSFIRSIIAMRVNSALGDVLWLVVFYLITVKIRKREPKNFFESKMVEARNER